MASPHWERSESGETVVKNPLSPSSVFDLFCFQSGQRSFLHLSNHSATCTEFTTFTCKDKKPADEAAYGFVITEDLFSWFPDAIYDCASLYTKNYRISGEYTLPKDDFLGTPKLNVSYAQVLS